jgi:predicted ester cyclase
MQKETFQSMNPNISKYLSSEAPRQSMRGFDEDYRNIVEYIVRSTDKIWEQRHVGLIYTHYLSSAQVHTPGGDVFGYDQVVANTVQTLDLFPDRRLFPDDVIWAGNDVDGFYSSHRIMSTAHHWGHGIYGPPTGKKLRYQVIADCFVLENRIQEEWLVRDDLSIIQQIGLNEHEFAAKLVSLNPDRFKTTDILTQIEQGKNQQSPGELPPLETKEFNIEDHVKRTWHDVWNRRMFNKIFESYVQTHQCHSATGRELYGPDELLQFVINWLACFPDGSMSFDHFCALGSDEQGYRTALRWTFTGTHRGYGIYGSPTGKPVKIMGITHQQVQDGKFVEEWTVFDELNILCQLHVPEEPEILEEELNIEGES